MDMHRRVALLQRGTKCRDMARAGCVEGDRDMRVADPLVGQQPLFIRQRFGMIVQRQIDHMAHADGRKPRRVARLELA